MVAPVVRLHVGAHKTASTYIQETLLLNRAESAAAGVAYWPLHTVRRSLRAARREIANGEDAGWKAPWNKSTDALQKAAERLNELLLDDYEVTISEENILGNPDDCYHSPFYRRASQTLELLKEPLKNRPVEVLLAVRSYPAFLASLYAEALRHGMFTTPEKMMQANQTCEGQWLHVIDTIRSALPHAKIIVWRYEDFAKVENDVLSRLSGLPARDMKKPSQSDILPSASPEAIEQMIQMARSLKPPQRVFKMLALKAEHPRERSNGGRFMPFSDDARARLRAEYEADLKIIEARDDVTLLS